MGLIKYILIFLVTTNTAHACPNPVTPIKKGEVAVCDGFLFSDKAEQEAAEYREDSKYYKELYIKYKQRSDMQIESQNVLEQRLKLYMDQSDKLAKMNSTNEWKKVIYFGLGFLTMYGAYQVAR